MSEYQKFNIETDQDGHTLNTEQRIARITSMYQAGSVRAEVAREAIGKLARGVYLAEIETVLLAVAPLDAVNMDQAVHRDRAAQDAQRVKEQGLVPRGKPTI